MSYEQYVFVEFMVTLKTRDKENTEKAMKKIEPFITLPNAKLKICDEDAFIVSSEFTNKDVYFDTGEKRVLYDKDGAGFPGTPASFSELYNLKKLEDIFKENIENACIHLKEDAEAGNLADGLKWKETDSSIESEEDLFEKYFDDDRDY